MAADLPPDHMKTVDASSLNLEELQRECKLGGLTMKGTALELMARLERTKEHRKKVRPAEFEVYVPEHVIADANKVPVAAAAVSFFEYPPPHPLIFALSPLFWLCCRGQRPNNPCGLLWTQQRNRLRRWNPKRRTLRWSRDTSQASASFVSCECSKR